MRDTLTVDGVELALGPWGELEDVALTRTQREVLEAFAEAQELVLPLERAMPAVFTDKGRVRPGRVFARAGRPKSRWSGWREYHRAYNKAWMRDWRRRNPEKARAKDRARYQRRKADPARNRLLLNRQTKYTRKWRAQHRQHVREQARGYWQKRMADEAKRAALRAWQRAYYHRVWKHKRRRRP